jgi:hypothetical protein
MKQNKGIDYSQGLIWAAALVGMIRYAAAFLASDMGQIVGVASEIITWLLGGSGFFMGLLSTFGTAYLFDGWRRKMPASGVVWAFKFKVLTLFVFAAFFFELVILVPFTVSRMQHNSMTDVLQNGVWWWSIAVNIMPLLLIGGVSVGNQIVTVESGQMTGQLTGQKADTNGQKEDNSKPSADVSDWRKAKKKLTGQQIAAIAKMSTGEIQKVYGVESRTARRWRKAAQDETTPPFP